MMPFAPRGSRRARRPHHPRTGGPRVIRNQSQPWWRRLIGEAMVPAYVTVRSADARRCPECRSAYEPRDRYCPDCKVAVPEWRFG